MAKIWLDWEKEYVRKNYGKKTCFEIANDLHCKGNAIQYMAKKLGIVTRKVRDDTLCWNCARAVGYCSWSQFFEPVKGWVAEKNTEHDSAESYAVMACPLFLKGRDRKNEQSPDRKRDFKRQD